MAKAMSRDTLHPNGVAERERRYESGLVEIGYYIPEVLKGAGPICLAVISRQEPGMKWNLYLNGVAFTAGPHRRSMVKAHMVRAALEHTQAIATLHRERFPALA